MKLHFMKSEALAYFKANASVFIDEYVTNDTNEWMYEKYKEYSGQDSPFEEFKFEVPEFQLEMPEKYTSQTDCNNVRILYTALKDLTPTQAADERFWSGLAHSELYDFVRYRITVNASEMNLSKVLNAFYFKYNKKRSLNMNILARLWWSGYSIYDQDNSNNPFAGLEYFNRDFSGSSLTLFSSNFTNNPDVTRAILKTLTEIENNGIQVGRKKFQEVIRYVNLLGGVVLLDYLTEDELREKIKQHFYQVNEIE